MLSALALLAALQAAPATAAPPLYPNIDDRDKAAELAALGTFTFGCLNLAQLVPSPAKYMAGVDYIAQQAKTQAAQLPDEAFSVSGVNGDTCRVIYRGAYIDDLWQKFAPMFDTKQHSMCNIVSSTPKYIKSTCLATKTAPAVAVVAERDASQLTMSMTWVGPKVQ